MKGSCAGRFVKGSCEGCGLQREFAKGGCEGCKQFSLKMHVF